MSGFARAAQFTPFTAVANVTGSARDQRPARPRRGHGLPIGVQLIGQPRGRGHAARARRQLEARGPGRTAARRSRPPRALGSPSTSAMALGRDAERLRVRDPARRWCSAPRAAPPRPTSRARACRAACSPRRSAPRTSGSGTCEQRPLAPGGAQRDAHHRVVRQRLRARELQALAALRRARGRAPRRCRPRRRRPRSAGTSARAAARDERRRAAARAARRASVHAVAGRVDERARARSSRRSPPSRPRPRPAPSRAGSGCGRAPSRRARRGRRTARRPRARRPRPCRQVAMPVELLDRRRPAGRGSRPARCTTVDTPRIALRNDGGSAEVAEGDLHADALGAQPPRVADEAADGRAAARPGAEAAPSRRARLRR